MGAAGLTPQGPSPAGSPTPDQGQSPDKALVAMGVEIDRALSAVSEAIGGSEEIAQARRLISSAIAAKLGGGDTAQTPTAAGSQFPGATPSAPVPRP